jgi:hypothetical protein
MPGTDVDGQPPGQIRHRGSLITDLGEIISRTSLKRNVRQVARQKWRRVGGKIGGSEDIPEMGTLARTTAEVAECTVLSLVIHYKMFKRVKGREEIELRAKRVKEEGKPFGLITWYHLRLSLTYITRQVNCFIITFLHVWNVFSSYS